MAGACSTIRACCQPVEWSRECQGGSQEACVRPLSELGAPAFRSIVQKAIPGCKTELISLFATHYTPVECTGPAWVLGAAPRTSYVRSMSELGFNWYIGSEPKIIFILAFYNQKYLLFGNGTGPRLQSRPRETLRPALSTQVQSTRSGAASMVCRGRSAP